MHTREENIAVERPDILTYEQLSERLQMPKRSLERYVAMGIIPHKKISRKAVRFYWPAIAAWLQDTKRTRTR